MTTVTQKIAFRAGTRDRDQNGALAGDLSPTDRGGPSCSPTTQVLGCMDARRGKDTYFMKTTCCLTSSTSPLQHSRQAVNSPAIAPNRDSQSGDELAPNSLTLTSAKVPITGELAQKWPTKKF